MAIDTKKILTARASDYFGARCISPHNYEPVGVHSSTSLDDLANKVPDDAEVVTDYEFAIANRLNIPEYHGSATAWVAKQR